MGVPDVANPPDPVRGFGIAQVAAQGIARIRGIGDDPAVAKDAGGLPDQARLGIDGMYFEVLGHRERDGRTDRESAEMDFRPRVIIPVDSNRRLADVVFGIKEAL